jgi:small subunit ribosomal protein S27e
MDKKSETKFLVVKHDCGNEQYVYDSVKTAVKCTMCGKPIAKPTGGLAEIIGKVIKTA